MKNTPKSNFFGGKNCLTQSTVLPKTRQFDCMLRQTGPLNKKNCIADAGVGRGYPDHPEHRRPCRYRDDWAWSPCSGIHSAECGPVVQRGVFGLKIGRNGTNYREPAFQIVGINAGSHIAADDVASKKPTCPCDWPDKIFGIVVKIVVKAKWGQPINKKVQRFLTWNRWTYGPARLDKSELFSSAESAVKVSSKRTVWVPSL